MEVVHHEASFPVCIVDADPAVRDSLASVIDLHGLPVRCYATGTQFLTETRRVLQVRSVLCDAQLPDLSGLDVYRQLVALGVTDIGVPWETLVLSVALFVALPAAVAMGRHAQRTDGWLRAAAVVGVGAWVVAIGYFVLEWLKKDKNGDVEVHDVEDIEIEVE